MCVKSDVLNLIDATIANGKFFVSCCLKIKNNKTFLEFLLSSTAWLNEYDTPLIERLCCLYHNILYRVNGFEITKQQAPGYYITDYESRWRREHFMKNKIKQRHPEVDASNKTEWQLEQELGYDRIWDAGKRLWTKNI